MLDRILFTKETVTFNRIAKAINGRPYNSEAFNNEGGIKVSKIGDVTNKRAFNSWEFVFEDEFENQKGQLLKDGDILMTLTGDPPDVGKVNYIYKPNKATWNQRVAKIKILNKEIFNSNESLYAVLSTEYSRRQLERFAKGIRQRNLGNESLERLIIPVLSFNFQKNLESLIKSRFSVLEKSKSQYNQAETLLLQEIGLEKEVTGLNPVEITNTNVKSLSESFTVSGRLDAEYYQKKYDVLEKQFDKFKRLQIKQIVNYPVSSGITPKAGGDDYSDAKNGISFIRATDLQNGEVSVSNLNYIKSEIHEGLLVRTKLKKNDVLLSIAGTVGRCALFTHDLEANINQAVAIIRFEETEVLRLYLVAFFNSPVGKEFVSKYSRQGVQTNLNLSEIGELSIPIIDYSKQQEIAQLIEESFSLKKQSEHLLEVAKKAVEIAIEESEEMAMKYINEN